MFDLEIIENDWKENCHALTEKEIIEIFKSDSATTIQYNANIEEWEKKTKVKFTEYSVEERLMQAIYGEYEDPELKRQRDREQRLLEIKLKKYPEPKKQHLSEENRKKIIEGTMNLVFDSVRYYFNLFEEQITKETLYYLFLDTLINVCKYVVHCGDPVFKMYIMKSFELSLIKYISKKEKIPYDKAADTLLYYKNKTHLIDNKILSKSKIIEEPLRPTDIIYYMKDECVEDTSLKELTTQEFFTDYNAILNSLSYEEKIVMQLSYDNYGYRGLTFKEIADYLGIEVKKIANIKKRTLKKVRKELVKRNYR